MKAKALVTILLAFAALASAQTGKPQATTFMHQTLGESIEDFMSISGAKMCASQKPQAAQWCETFKKIQAGEKGVVTDSQGSTSVSLVFAEKRLVQVLVQGKADWSKSITEFTQKYGAPDVQTANAAEWAFSDGGGVSVTGQPDNLFTATFFSKDAKPTEKKATASATASNMPTQERSIAAPVYSTAFRNFVLGANFNDIVAAGIIRAEMCDGKVKREMKEGCKDLEKARSGQFVAVVIEDDQKGRVVLNFEGGKLIAVRIETPYETTFDDQLLELTKKYGKPTTLDSVAVQNGYGAKWNEGFAVWEMPDGAEIREAELILWGHRRVHVDFKSKELVEKEHAARAAKQMTY